MQDPKCTTCATRLDVADSLPLTITAGQTLRNIVACQNCGMQHDVKRSMDESGAVTMTVTQKSTEADPKPTRQELLEKLAVLNSQEADTLAAKKANAAAYADTLKDIKGAKKDILEMLKKTPKDQQ